jgi:hypothetical protein
MEKLAKLISNKIVINSLLSVFWILLLSEKYEKAIAGDTKSIVFSLLYCLMLVFTTYSIIKAIKDSKTKKE